MEDLKEYEGFYVVEWVIENFSCWNREIHGTVIKSAVSSVFGGLALQLYPRGQSGCEERLSVQITSNEWILAGDLSFVSSDGSQICRQQVASNDEVVLLLPGPEFKKVVDEIRKNEILHKDRLILRCRVKWTEGTTQIEYMHTMIKVFNVAFEISCDTYDRLDSNIGEKFFIILPEVGKHWKGIIVSVFKDEDVPSKLTLKLVAEDINEMCILVITRMPQLTNNHLGRIDVKEHCFRENSSTAVFSFTPTKEEIKDLKETPWNVCLKITGGIINKDSLFLFKTLKRKVDIWPSIHNTQSRTCITSTHTPDTSSHKDDSATELGKQLMCLYQDQDFSDFQLKCGDVTFPVHKNILSARSPVFKTMLCADMKEAASGSADIRDLDIPTLTKFLAFLYTGAVEDLQSDSALKLYYAADKYQVPSLKRECAEFLCANVSVSNVCDILSLADKHQDSELVAAAHNLMLESYNEVLDSDQWQDFMNAETLLAVKTLTYFAKKSLVKRSGTS